ncbi:MAG: MBL fold metallo-hydrolase [Bacteroidota bacterium]
MQVTVLTDNHAGGGFGAEHGLSYWIDYDGYKLLLDAGHSRLYLENANLLNIDVQQQADAVVLTHGHWDHGDGLRYISGKPLFTHPASFMKRYRQKDHSYIGLDLSEKIIGEQFELHTSKQPVELVKGLWFLGEVPRTLPFDTAETTFEDSAGTPDYVPDDSGVAAIVNGSLVVISGCAHAGICNTVLHAQRVTGINSVKAVMGGTHLKKNDQRLKETIEWLKTQDVEQVLPSHCTELPALAAFYQAFESPQLATGQTWDFT